MNYSNFSEKQLLAMTWWKSDELSQYDALICDGSVRSGKTMTMAIGFIMWAFSEFKNQKFAICGKTIESVRRNVTTNIPVWLEGIIKFKERRTENLLIISFAGKTNFFYLFGGKDESSAYIIQGITLAGVLFDEVAIMPRSFVEQALARCSVEGSRFWFNCNPENPEHWFYKEWILKTIQKNALWLHFTMKDNYSLSEKIRNRYESMYSGVFYKRFVLGEWVSADGLIYQQFANNEEQYTVQITDEYLYDVDFISIGIDFGGTKSLTTFVASAIHRNFSKVTVIKDHHIEGRKGDIDANRVCREFIEFFKSIRKTYPGLFIKYVFADSEAQYLINSLRNAIRNQGLGLEIGDSAKYPIIQRIVAGNTLLNTGRMFIADECELVQGGLRLAMWDEKKPDTRLDNFSTDIDIIDAYEYSWERFINRLCPLMKAR